MQPSIKCEILSRPFSLSIYDYLERRYDERGCAMARRRAIRYLYQNENTRVNYKIVDTYVRNYRKSLSTPLRQLELS